MTTSILLHVGGSLADFDIIHHRLSKVKHYFSFFQFFLEEQIECTLAADCQEDILGKLPTLRFTSEVSGWRNSHSLCPIGAVKGMNGLGSVTSGTSDGYPSMI